jgi:hypothetical protein
MRQEMPARCPALEEQTHSQFLFQVKNGLTDGELATWSRREASEKFSCSATAVKNASDAVPSWKSSLSPKTISARRIYDFSDKPADAIARAWITITRHYAIMEASDLPLVFFIGDQSAIQTMTPAIVTKSVGYPKC